MGWKVKASVFTTLLVFIVFTIIRILLAKFNEKKLEDDSVKAIMDSYDDTYDILNDSKESDSESKISGSDYSNSIPTPINIPNKKIDKYTKGGILVSALVSRYVMELLMKKVIKHVVKTDVTKGVRLLVKMGLMTLDPATLARMGIKVATKTAKFSAQVGAKVASHSMLYSIPVVDIVMLAYDVMSIALDASDAGGYAKMTSNKAYLKMRDEINKSVKEEFAKEGAPFPIVVGPLDELSEDEFNESLKLETSNLIYDPDSIYMNDILKKVIDLSIPEDKLESFISSEIDKLDFDVILDKALHNVCIQEGGKVIGTDCSYATEDECNNTYDWPIPEDSETDTYVEWKTNVDGKNNDACMLASSAMRTVCEGNDLKYDTRTGSCIVDEKYCLSKGASWKYNDDLKAYDCHVSISQSFFEFMFGTTVVRGLKQVFSPNQYSKCEKGEEDDGYTCRKMTCPEGYPDVSGLLCYPSCKDGYSGSGPLCWENCPDGYKDDDQVVKVSSIAAGGIVGGILEQSLAKDGVSCSLTGYCEPDKDHVGPICYDKCREGYSGAGPLCMKSCPDGFTNDGATCRRSGYCEPGQDNSAGFCYEPCRAGYEGVGPVCSQKCPTGFSNAGLACTKPREYGRGFGKARIRCRDDEERGTLGALCYPKCAPGYHAFGNNICSADCPAGMNDVGPLCTKGTYTRGGTPDTKIIVKDTYGRGPGKPDISIKLKDKYGRGVGKIPKNISVTAKHRVVDFSTKKN